MPDYPLLPAHVQATPAAPPENGLVVSAREPQDPPGTRWENGLAFDPESCSYVASFDPTCGDGTVEFPTGRTDRSDVKHQPMGIVSANVADSMCRTYEDVLARAERQLNACTSRQLEDEFWRGTRARDRGWTNNFYLAEEGATDRLSNVAVATTDALACLERALMSCKCGGRGMIHATADVVTHWARDGLVKREGGLIVTVLNTIVVPGEGYDGTGPAARADGPAAAPSGASWAYATGRVDVRLGPVVLIPGRDAIEAALDRGINDFRVYATRFAAATHDGCCSYGVLVDAEPCLIGGGS